MRRLPPLNSIKAFDAVSRNGSISKAAAELSVSASAVSQQIATLEDWMGAPLLLRRANSSELTEGGHLFAKDLFNILNGLEQAVEAASQDQDRNELRLTVLPSLAARWLVKRLNGYSSAHKGCRISLEASYDNTDFQQGGFDLEIRSGSGSYAGACSLKLFDEYVSPACSPQYWEKNDVPMEHVADCKLLNDETFGNDTTNLNWNVWMERQNIAMNPALSPTHHFTDSNLTIQAAVNGEGLMLGRSVLIAEEIQKGTLIYPFKQRQISDWPYFIIYPQKSHPPRQPLRGLIEWLLEAAALTDGIASAAELHSAELVCLVTQRRKAHFPEHPPAFNMSVGLRQRSRGHSTKFFGHDVAHLAT